MQDGRAEDQKLPPVEGHGQTRPGNVFGVEEPVRPARSHAHLAITVENDEGVALLQRASRPRGRPAIDDVRAPRWLVFIGRHQSFLHALRYDLECRPVGLHRLNIETNIVGGHTRGREPLLESRPNPWPGRASIAEGTKALVDRFRRSHPSGHRSPREPSRGGRRAPACRKPWPRSSPGRRAPANR